MLARIDEQPSAFRCFLLPLASTQTYHYNLDTGACHDPLRLRYSHHVKQPVDLEAMQAAASILVGTHDFTQVQKGVGKGVQANTCLFCVCVQIALVLCVGLQSMHVVC